MSIAHLIVTIIIIIVIAPELSSNLSTGVLVSTDAGFHGNAAPDDAGHAHLLFHRGEVFTKHPAHHGIKPS